MTYGALMQTDIRRLLDDLGYDLTLRRPGAGAYDPSTSGTASGSATDITVRGFFGQYNEREVDGTSVQRGDRKAVLSGVDANNDPLSLVPQIDDKLIGESDDVTIIDVRTVKANGSVIGYVCQVRE